MKQSGLIVLGIVLALALLAAGVWLVIGQHRLGRQLEALRLENAQLNGQLAEALARNPGMDAAELASISRRLQDTASLVARMESRLSNASTQFPQGGPMIATRPGGIVAPASPGSRRLPRGQLTFNNLDLAEATTAARPPGPPVSSHSANGELLHRNWGPEQVVGPPDTFEAGDQPTAWAPYASQGGKDEWLQLNYDRPVDLAEIRVLETYNPGAIARVMAVLPGGAEMSVWEGVTPPAQAPVDTAFPVTNGLRAQSIKIYFDRTRAPGWNEIDAVEVVGRDGTRQWATSATASSSFADR